MYEARKIPIPKGHVLGTGRPRKYPFATMDVGTSFLIPLPEQTVNTAKAMQVYCWRMGRKLNRVFNRLVLDDGTIQVLRSK